jgi:GNAT superfamily N-acetyltransferase
MTLRISTDLAELNVDMIHRFLSEQSYWARGISRARVERALARSLCFGGFTEEQQVAFGRVVTDRATMAHLKDVFVLPAYRGRGYGIAIVQAIVSHPDLQDVPMSLATDDAHALYTRFGFVVDDRPSGRQMLRALQHS